MNDNELANLRNALQSGVVDVEFTKADGTRREMTCTQYVEFIPEESMPAGDDPVAAGANDVIRVFDLDLQEWRAFKPSRVVTWMVNPNPSW